MIYDLRFHLKILTCCIYLLQTDLNIFLSHKVRKLRALDILNKKSIILFKINNSQFVNKTS